MVLKVMPKARMSPWWQVVMLTTRGSSAKSTIKRKVFILTGVDCKDFIMHAEIRIGITKKSKTVPEDPIGNIVASSAIHKTVLL